MKFRAVVLHVTDPESYSSYSDVLLRIANRLNASTSRVVLREPSDDVDVELKAVYAGEGIKGLNKAWELIKQGYFTSFSIGREPPSSLISQAVDLIYRISEEMGPEFNVMFALSSGEPSEGPYFPVTKSSSFGMSASLLYPSDLYGFLKDLEEPSGSLRQIMTILFQEAEKELILALEDEGGIPYIGIDFSLSPWMEESSAKVVSMVSKSPFMEAGTASAILEINKAISDSSYNLKYTGFNEIMLPMAEDNLLKEMAYRGLLTARNLAYLTPYCVAGLDMVVLPLSTPRKEIAKLIRDVLAASQVKEKIIGVRIVMVDAKPGEMVDLKMFGKVPVMKL